MIQGRQMFRMIFWLGWWGLGLHVLAALLLRWGTGDQLLTVRLTNYLMPWLLAALLPGMAAAFVSQRRCLATLLAGCALFISALHAPLFFPRPSAEASGNFRLKVMSYNVWSRNTRVAEMADVIRTQKPDLLLIQEIKPKTFASLIAALTDLYPGSDLQFRYAPELLQAVLSRYPLSAGEIFRKKGQAQKVVAATPLGEITVFNVHPLRRGGWARRHDQMRMLMEEEIASTRGPVILGGDFNTTDQTATFRLLANHLHNSHHEAAFGFGFTWPAARHQLLGGFRLPALVRIDHIFYSSHFQAVSAGTLANSGGSDHKPVFVLLSSPRPAPLNPFLCRSESLFTNLWFKCFSPQRLY